MRTAVGLVALVMAGLGLGGCASPSEEKREQVQTAQNQMFGPYSSQRAQRRNNVEARR